MKFRTVVIGGVTFILVSHAADVPADHHVHIPEEPFEYVMLKDNVVAFTTTSTGTMFVKAL